MQRAFELVEVLLELAEVVNWRDVVLHLGVPNDVMDGIELHYNEVEKQKTEAVTWWMNNSATASWKELSDALWKTNCPLMAGTVNVAIMNNS